MTEEVRAHSLVTEAGRKKIQAGPPVVIASRSLLTEAGRKVTAQFIGSFTSVAALPSTGLQAGDWAIIVTGPPSTSGLHSQDAAWDGATWTTYSVNEGGTVIYPDNVVLGAAGSFLPARRTKAQRDAL